MPFSQNRCVEQLESNALAHPLEHRDAIPAHTAGREECSAIETQLIENRATEALATAQRWVSQAVADSNHSTVDLTVVIPVYNEPHTIIEIVAKVRLLPISKQIIVVNDGSTDATSQSLILLERSGDIQVVHHGANRGKGAALQTGFKLAQGKYVIVQDADLEYDPADILKVIQPLADGRADVAYGSRYLGSAPHDPSWVHRFGNWLLTHISNSFTGYRLTDMETCYKAFRRDVLSTIQIEQQRFGFEPEITAKLARSKMRIEEVAISYNSRGWDEGKKIGWRDLVNTLYCIIRYSWFPTR